MVLKKPIACGIHVPLVDPVRTVCNIFMLRLTQFRRIHPHLPAHLKKVFFIHNSLYIWLHFKLLLIPDAMQLSVPVTAELPASQRDNTKHHRQVFRDSNHTKQVSGKIQFIAAEYKMDIEKEKMYIAVCKESRLWKGSKASAFG